MKTKKELIQIREESYGIREVKICRTCKHSLGSFERGDNGRCYAIPVRGDAPFMKVFHTGHCALWEPKK
jgi:hypothetical protein